MNQLAARDILTVTEKQAHIHVSGHPGQPELAALYGWLRPRLIVPVHGEIRHMHEQARFALEQRVPDALVQENGDLVRLAPGPARILERVRSGRLILDGDVILPADGETINERRKLSFYGQISVAVVLSRGKFADSAIQYRGVPVEDEREAFLDEMNAAAEKAAKMCIRDRHNRAARDRCRQHQREIRCFPRLDGGRALAHRDRRPAHRRRIYGAVSYTHLDVYKRQRAWVSAAPTPSAF